MRPTVVVSPFEAAHDASTDGAGASPAPSPGSFRRSLTWTTRSRTKLALKAGRASLPGATAVVTTPAAPRPGSAPQQSSPDQSSPVPSTTLGKPPRPRPAPSLTPPTLTRPGSAPDPQLADDAAARLRQVFRQRAALAHAAWPDGGEGRGDTWPSPFRAKADGGRVGRSPHATGRPLEDSPSRMHSGKVVACDDDDDAALPSFGDRHRGALIAAAAVCAAAAHWPTVAAALATIAPTPQAAVLMAVSAALLAASGACRAAADWARRVAATSIHGLAAVERLCAVIDSLGLLPILLARLEAELGAVGTDIRTIRRKADWLPSRPRGGRAD